MVICHLGVIENLFGFQQCSSCQRGCKCLVIAQTFQNSGAFGIDIITQIGSVYTWIGSHFLLIQGLDNFQRFISGIGKFLVTFHLQRSQVKQAERCLPPLLLGDTCHCKRRILNLRQQSKPTLVVGNGVDTSILFFFFRFLAGSYGLFLLLGFQYQLLLAFPDNGRESSISIDGFQLPVLLGNKMLYFQLTVYNQCQCRRLHTADRKYLSVLPILHGVEAGGIHPQQPVANGTRESGFVQRLEIRRIAQLGKALADSLFRQ